MSMTAGILYSLIAIAWLTTVIGAVRLVRLWTNARRAELEEAGFLPSTAELLTLMDHWHVFNISMLAGFVAVSLAVLVMIYDAAGYWS